MEDEIFAGMSNEEIRATYMTTPERSVEEIVEEIMEAKPDCDCNDCRAEFRKNIDNTLQTERQRCEEMVEAERERILVIIAIHRGNLRGEEDVNIILHDLQQDLTQPNNPK